MARFWLSLASSYGDTLRQTPQGHLRPLSTLTDRFADTVGQHFHRDVAALDSLRGLTVQAISDLADSLQIAIQRFLEQLSSDGAQVARVVASADFHPQRVSKRLLPVHGA